MKTGRLLKFQRPGGVVQAYLYGDGDLCKAAVYVMTAAPPRAEPLHRIEADTDAEVERLLRAWVDEHYPRST